MGLPDRSRGRPDDKCLVYLLAYATIVRHLVRHGVALDLSRSSYLIAKAGLVLKVDNIS